MVGSTRRRSRWMAAWSFDSSGGVGIWTGSGRRAPRAEGADGGFPGTEELLVEFPFDCGRDGLMAIVGAGLPFSDEEEPPKISTKSALAGSAFSERPKSRS